MTAAPVETLPLYRELLDLEKRVAEMQNQPVAISRERTEAAAKVEEAKAELRRYHARVAEGEKASTARQGGLSQAIAEAQAALLARQWDIEISGARLAAHNAHDVVEEFLVENAEGLAEELIQLAFARRAEFVSLVHEAIEGWQRLNEVGSMWGQITEHLPGGRAGNVVGRDPNMGDAVDRLRRYVEVEIVLPIPRTLATGAAA